MSFKQKYQLRKMYASGKLKQDSNIMSSTEFYYRKCLYEWSVGNLNYGPGWSPFDEKRAIGIVTDEVIRRKSKET